MKKSEIFTELSVKLAQIEAKVDFLIEQQKKHILLPIVPTKTTPDYILSKGDLTEAGVEQEWRPSGDLNV